MPSKMGSLFDMRSIARQQEPNMIDKIYRLPEVTAVTGLCRTVVYNALVDKAFPDPVILGRRAVGWRESDLMAWVQSRQKRTVNK